MALSSHLISTDFGTSPIVYQAGTFKNCHPVKYSEKSYWDQRFELENQTGDGQHEWFTSYDSFKHLIFEEVKEMDVKNIMILGCGNSTLSAELAKDFPEAVVTSTDYSEIVIKHMAANHGQYKNLVWKVADIRSLPSTKYDLVIEKGVVDALLAGQKSRNLESMTPTLRLDMENTFRSIRNTLNHNSKFISISFDSPFLRRKILEHNIPWKVRSRKFISPVSNFEYNFYVCKPSDSSISHNLDIPTICPIEIPENDVFSIDF